MNARIETSTFDELKSTGNLEIIDNKAIIDSLMHYCKWIDFIQVGVEQSIRNYTHLNIGPYLMEKYPMNFNSNPYVDYTDEKYSVSNWKIREDFYLTNALEWRKILINSIRQGYGRAQSKNGYLLKMLNTEIKD